jgi:pimeloyl-ACP methyl ester carboxylesterase
VRSRPVDVGTQVTLREWGEDGGGRRILALHALGPVSTGALFGCAVGPLVEAGWEVVAPDLPGFGGSPPLAPDGYDITRMAELMWRVVGDGPVTLLGHSVGGAVALRMHTLQPGQVDALVLLDSGHVDYGVADPDVGARTLDEWLAEAAPRFTAANRAALAEAMGLNVDDPLLDDLRLGMTDTGSVLVSRTNGVTGAAARFALAQSRCSTDWPVLAAAGTPTLLLLATAPEEARRQNEEWGARFADAVPHAQVRPVDGATHSITTDLRDRLGRDLADWLGSLTRE